MTLTLDLPPDLESELVADAARLGIPLAEYALRLLAGVRIAPALGTGTDVVEYWKREGLLGTRPEIEDAPAHARTLREHAQKEARSR